MTIVIPNPFKVLFVTRDSGMTRHEKTINPEYPNLMTLAQFVPVHPRDLNPESVQGTAVAVIDLAEPELNRVAHRVHRMGMDRDCMTPMTNPNRNPEQVIIIAFLSWCQIKRLVTREQLVQAGIIS